MACIYNGLLLSHKKHEILSFATTWMTLEGVMLSEANQRKRNTMCLQLYIESKKPSKGRLGGSVVEHLSSAQVRSQGPGIESHIGLPTGSHRKPASPSAYVSASLCLS